MSSAPYGSRLPPQNLEAEESVLGALLLDREAIIQVADILRPEHFYSEANRLIYGAAVELYDAREPIDLVTLTNQLRKNKHLAKAGGSAGLARLTNVVPTAANAKNYAQIVKNLYTKREIITLSGSLTEKAFDEGVSAQTLLDSAEQTVFGLSRHHVQGNFISMKDVLVESFDRIEELHKNQSGVRGVPSGFSDLDHILSGLQNSNLIILAARPDVSHPAKKNAITQVP